ncbi:hypothetical protein OIE66_04935 [Nonomuraea sp. NBC_01738]|uniref:hypothetical protein n=1 Tax=Nonomuraea sp. NBC_01738 TaxID=2976003 RepID=UPI002E0D60F0|nr:hypothetical protein OIE66_04935 [Nonomuraea sp. NBC_01738]
MAVKAKTSQWPVVLFLCGAAVGQFGAIQPGFGYPWRPSAFVTAAALIGVALVLVKAADVLSERAWQRVRLAGFLTGALLVANQVSTSGYATGMSRAGSILLYATAAVMAVWHHTAPARARARGTLLVASGVEPGRVRAMLAELPQDTVAVYRTDRPTGELDDLGVIIVTGAEHDPRAKEKVSTSGLARQVPDLAEREVVLAGPRPFARYVRGAVTRAGVPAARVRTARFKPRQKA